MNAARYFVFLTLALGAACSRSPTTPEEAKPASSVSPGPRSTASAQSAFVVASPKPYADPPASALGALAPNTGVPVGSAVPDVSALDLSGTQVRLASLYSKGPILLAFYRGGWCPYCNMEIHSLTLAYPEYQKRGVTPVALSVDQPAAEAEMRATYTVPFPLLSDQNAKAIAAFQLVKTVSGEELAKMKSFGVDLEHYSGTSQHQIAIPALFLIDRAGIVRWAHSDPDFKVRPNTAQILAAIDAAKLDVKD